MKILLVQPYALGPGHYDPYTRRLSAALCGQGADITLLTAAGTKEGWEKRLPLKHIATMKRDSPLLFTAETLHGLMKRVRLLWTGWKVQQLALKHYATGKYDVLHFVDAELLTLVVLYSHFGKPRNVFLTIPEAYRTCFSPGRFYRPLYDALRRAAARQLFKYVTPITHSPKVRETLFEMRLVSSDNVPVIPWGIDAPLVNCDRQEARRMLGISEQAKLFGFFGHLLPQKDLHVVLEAWPSMAQNCTLLIAAHAEATVEDRIRRWIRTTGIESRVMCHFGYVAEAKLDLYMRACDAVLLPYKRTFQGESGVLAQACANQVPVIAADTGALGEAVRSGDLGIVFKPESPSALQEAIDRFLRLGKEEVDQIKEKMKALASARSWTAVARQHLIAYQNPVR